MAPQPAVVLLSGGLDSATTLGVAKSRGLACHCLTFDYGQRHRHELAASARVARSLGAAEHVTMKIDLRAFGGSALTADIDVPKDRSAAAMDHDIPVTYVPARNLVFLSMAVGLAEVRSARHIFIGVNAVDYSGYPDCRPEFIAAFQNAANLATKAGVEDHGVTIETPLSGMSKAQIIRTAHSLAVDLSLTHSCYDPSPDGAACGHCDSCLIRKRGFAEAGLLT